MCCYIIINNPITAGNIFETLDHDELLDINYYFMLIINYAWRKSIQLCYIIFNWFIFSYFIVQGV